MDQPSGVGVMKRVGNRGDQFGCIATGRSSLSDPGRQVAAFDELRHDETDSVVRAADIENRHDVGMVQPGENPGFDQKRFEIFGIADPFGVGHLDGDRRSRSSSRAR